MHPTIAIVGAGPGGLTLARILHQAKISCSIFDLRSKSASSPVSGSLDLHAESGQRALRAAGLYQEFMRVTRPNSEDTILADKSGHVCFSDAHSGTRQCRPEIDRSLLTELLLSSIPNELIKWDHKVLSVSPSARNCWTVNFESQKSQTFDLVIGADGAWSRVRQALTPIKPQYSGIHCITLAISAISSKPGLAEVVGDGTLFALGDGKALLGQRGSTDSVCIYAMLSSPSALYQSSSEPAIDTLSLPAMKQKLVSDPRYFGDWGDKMKALVLAASEDPEHYIQPRPLYMLPIGLTWTSTPGVTLLGDAAHLMTPFSGEGVNLAMLDALELAQIIIDAMERENATQAKSFADQSEDLMLIDKSTWDTITRNYEMQMFPRAQEIMQNTYDVMEVMFAKDAPKGMLRMFESHRPPSPAGA